MIQRLRLARHRFAMTLSVATISVVMAAPAHASGSSMPWEQPLQQILQSIEGPVAKIVAVLAGRGADRRLAELVEVRGLAPSGDYALVPVGDSK